MKLAVVAPSGTGRDASRLARHVHALVPLLRERSELTVFEPSPVAVPGSGARPGRSLEELEPRAFEQVLWFVADDPACAPLWPCLRVIGGTVALFEWGLGRAALAAFPELASGGPRASWIALREGGAPALRRVRDGTLTWVVEAQAASGGDVPALNRAVVRQADCFLVPTEELRERIRADRNEPTPIAVTPWDVERDAAAVADAWIAALEAFPTHRSGRTSVVRTMLAGLAGRAVQGRDAPVTGS